MTRPPQISIIIPVEPSSPHLALSLIDIDRELHDAPFRYELLVVADLRIERVADVVRKFSSSIKNIKLIINPVPVSSGEAVKIGLRAGSGLWRVVYDPAGPMSAGQIVNAMHQVLTSGESAGMLAGIRWGAPGANVSGGPVQKIIAKFFDSVMRSILRTRTRDLSSGILFMSERAAEDVIPRMRIKSLAYAGEAITLAEFLKIPIKTIAIESSPDGRMNYLQMFMETLKIRWWLLTGAYRFSKTHNKKTI